MLFIFISGKNYTVSLTIRNNTNTMPRISDRRRLIKYLRRKVGQRQRLLIMELCDDDGSSDSDSGNNDADEVLCDDDSSNDSGSGNNDADEMLCDDGSSNDSGSGNNDADEMLCDDDSSNDSGSGNNDADGSSSSNGSSDDDDDTTCGLIFAAAYELSNDKLNFAEKNRYLFPRGNNRKSNDDVFIHDLNDGVDNPLPWLTEDEFKQQYRVSRENLDKIYEKIKDHQVFKNKRGPRQMHPKHQLMVLLNYLGTEGSGANNNRQKLYFRIGYGSAHNMRKRALKAILSLGDDYVKWPDAEERKKISDVYKKKFNLPNCVGVIDGTLFPLVFKPQTKDATDYHGRKFPWSLTCVLVSDDKRRIRWYITGYPGSAHDNRMWRKSPLKLKKEEFFAVLEYIIGDTAFDPSEIMVSAYKCNPGRTEPDDVDECIFNRVISKPRVSSEHVNGMWKGRFPWLRNIPNRIKGKKSLNRVLQYIHCTVILHNLLIELKDEHVESWDRDDDVLSDIADPKRAPLDAAVDMLPEERMLYQGVPEDAPKDWRRETVKNWLRETQALFERRQKSHGHDDDDDVDMEDVFAIEEQFEEYFNNINRE